jgi:PAS domain S-box-containing protein
MPAGPSPPVDATDLDGPPPASFDCLVAELGTGVIQTALDGRVIRLNDACARLFGFASPEEARAAISDTGHQIWVDPRRRVELFSRLIVEGRIDGAVAQLRRGDGGVFWASQAMRLLADPSGGERSILATITDISAVVDQRRALAAVERDYRSIFENATLGVHRSTLDGRRLRANPALCRLLGFADEAQMLAWSGDAGNGWYVAPGRRAAFMERLARDGKVVSFESEIFRGTSRTTLWVRETAWTIRDIEGRTIFFEGMVEDIGAERAADELRRVQDRISAQMQEVLARSAERLRSFADIATDWYWESDAQGRITFLSEGIAQLGLTAAALDRGDGADFPAAVDGSSPGHREMRAAMARRRRFKDLTCEIGAPDGRRFMIATSGEPQFDADGVFRGYRCVGRDETELVEARQALERALVAAHRATEQEQRFAAAVAHEFRTPLTIIDGAAQRLQRQIDAPDPDDMRTRLLKIRGAVGSMETLIDTMLDSARLAAGRLSLERRPVDLVAFVEAQIRRFDPAITGREIVLQATVPQAPVNADPPMLEHIVANLLSNALKYSGTSRRVDLTIAVDAAAGTASLAVRDHGVGIPADELPRLFERFFRASTAKGIPGTGIGLSLVNDLVERHDGRISVESEPGRGSCFTVTLPLLQDATTG